MAQLTLFQEAPQKGARLPKSASGRKATTILSPAVGRIQSFDFSLNPYVGCRFGCSYCYAAAFAADYRMQREWGEWVEVKENALGLIQADSRLPGARVYVGSATDPYQPVEQKLELTRQLLAYMSKLPVQPKIVIQTRAPLVTRDIDLLSQFSSARVNISITTDCDEVRKRFEPACPSIEQRLKTLQTLVDAGIKTTVCVSPMLPVVDAKSFANRLAEIGPDVVTASWFHRPNQRFAAGTRDEGLQILRESGWTRGDYWDAIDVLRDHLPQFVKASEAFGPEKSVKVA
jgi:DNA repair photolyase